MTGVEALPPGVATLPPPAACVLALARLLTAADATGVDTLPPGVAALTLMLPPPLAVLAVGLVMDAML